MPYVLFQNRASSIERGLLLRGAVALNRTPDMKSPDQLVVLPWPFRESEQAQQIQVRQLRDEIWNMTDFVQYFFLLTADKYGGIFEDGVSTQSIEYQAIRPNMLVINSKHGHTQQSA